MMKEWKNKEQSKVKSAHKFIGIIQEVECYIPQIRVWHENRFIKTTSRCIMRRPKIKCLNRVMKKKNKEPEEYIFTFGVGQRLEGYCVRVKGSYNIARIKMHERFGNEWAFQYSAEEWKKLKNDSLELRLEEEIPFNEL